MRHVEWVKMNEWNVHGLFSHHLLSMHRMTTNERVFDLPQGIRRIDFEREVNLHCSQRGVFRPLTELFAYQSISDDDECVQIDFEGESHT